MLSMLLRDRRRHMANTSTRTGLQLRSTVKKEGIVELSLASVPTPEPKPEEVIVRIEATPINPSDQGLLFGGADMSTAKASGTADNPAVTASISPAVMKAMAGRLDRVTACWIKGRIEASESLLVPLLSEDFRLEPV